MIKIVTLIYMFGLFLDECNRIAIVWKLGALNSQSSNDESRPSTHPDDYAQPPPKRFVNVDKYLDESSSESNLPLKTLAEIR